MDMDGYPDVDPARTLGNTTIVSRKVIAIVIAIMHIKGLARPGGELSLSSGLQRCSNSLYAYHVPSSIVLCVNCNKSVKNTILSLNLISF